MAPPSRTSPWFAVDAAWWPGVAAAIPKPWPQEAIMLDLRWWADQEALHPGSRPGRPELVERWGVSDWTARQALKSAHIWASPLHRASSGPPEPLQRPSRSPPHARSSPDCRCRVRVNDPPQPPRCRGGAPSRAGRRPGARRRRARQRGAPRCGDPRGPSDRTVGPCAHAVRGSWLLLPVAVRPRRHRRRPPGAAHSTR